MAQPRVARRAGHRPGMGQPLTHRASNPGPSNPGFPTPAAAGTTTPGPTRQ